MNQDVVIVAFTSDPFQRWMVFGKDRCEAESLYVLYRKLLPRPLYRVIVKLKPFPELKMVRRDPVTVRLI